MAQDTWAKIDDWMKSRANLHGRMDETRDLTYMTNFTLTMFDGTGPLDNVVNVTGNRAASYGTRVIENLASYKWQTVVEGEVTKREAHSIEDFLNASLDQTNFYLSENFDDVPDLYTFWAKHICNRGRIGVHWMSWMEKGEYKIHCAPLDMRYVAYVRNKWAAPIYFRKKIDLEQELEEYAERAKSVGGKYTQVTLGEDNEVRDHWGVEKGKYSNELWVNNQLAYTQDYPLFKRLPFVFVVSPSGFMYRDKGYVEHEGEDIYFLIKKLDKEINRSLSIEQTLGMDILYPGTEQSRKNMDSRPPDPMARTGEVGVVREGEEHKPVPRGDMNQASFAARQDLYRMVDEGAPLAPRAYTQPPSAIEVVTEVELLNQLYNSRVTALQMGLSQLFRLMVDMTVSIGKGQIEVGGQGKKKNFSVVQLKDPNKYTISCRLMGKNSKLDIINEARASALWGRAPLKYILEDVLRVEDPAGWERALDIQKAKEADPAIGLAEMGVRYAEEAEEMEDTMDRDLKNFQSKLLIASAVSMIKARQQTLPPVNQPEIPEQTSNANPLAALTGKAGMGVAMPKLARGVTT